MIGDDNNSSSRTAADPDMRVNCSTHFQSVNERSGVVLLGAGGDGYLVFVGCGKKSEKYGAERDSRAAAQQQSDCGVSDEGLRGNVVDECSEMGLFFEW